MGQVPFNAEMYFIYSGGLLPSSGNLREDKLEF